ncbi:O-antigen ligase domain-containing protein [Stutzerimonas nitrititolerans]|uniref:O-antigen ligase domain-containing protein n=1 Tax=Stutzerimonas nitrititolerans TaxID=2482751 RepID=UPI000EC3BB1E|nr:O-antigen ligase domain-containing protein [Stutzerimonas nitrititolerans]HCL78330.1 hypothetical protein [Pseudomonas sp.]
MFSELIREDRTSRRYFFMVLVVFLLSYIFGASSKWTNNIFYVLIALPGLFFLIRERGANLFSHSLGWTWLVFLLWFLIPAYLSADGQFYKHILYVALFVFIVAGLQTHTAFRSVWFARALFWIIAFYVYAYALYAYATGVFIFGGRVGLYPARMENVIYISIWMWCALALAMPLWVRNRCRVEAGAAVLLALVAVTFVMQTRTALVGAAFLFSAWTCYALWRFPKVASLWLLALSVLGLATLWLLKDFAWFNSLFERGDSYRIELFRIMVGEWRDCGWMLGCGVNFRTEELLGGGMPIQHPHNIFVSLGVYTGAGALLLFLVLMVMTLVQAVRYRDPWGMYLACALVMLNFDGGKLIGNPDELWPLVLLPAALLMGRAVSERTLDRT